MLDSLFEEVEKVRQAKSVLSRLPEDIDLTPEAIENNEIRTSSQSTPFLPLNTLIGIIDDSNVVKIYTPSLNPRLLSALDNREPLKELEFIGRKSAFRIVEQSVVDSLKEPESHRVLSATELPTYGICLTSDNASLITYNEEMRMSSIVVSDGTNQLSNWLNQRYESIKAVVERDNALV
uniref:hypothetical protein n=1 Tax=Halopelagius longus TaxID=1236180 RepID=UPI00111413C0|nr:hypothetical protein [Halopelagius longus]